MTRMDAPSAPVDREGLKREIVAELTQEARRKKVITCGGCLLALLVALGLPTLWVLSYVARTGFVEVPVLTPWLYSPSKPERQVLPLGGSTSESVLRAVLARSSLDPHTSLLTFVFKEEDLTTLIAHAVWLAPKGSLPFAISQAQFAVDSGTIELFLVSPRPHREATVLVRVSPHVERNGKISYDVQEMRIGAFKVPRGLAGILFATLGSFITETFRKQAADVGTIIDVVPLDRQLKILIAPKLVQ